MQRYIITLVLLVIVGVGAYYLGLRSGPSGQIEAGRQTKGYEEPVISKEAHERLLSFPKEEAKPVGTPERQKLFGDPGVEVKIQKFRMGARNAKVILPDGDISWVGTSGGLVRYDTTNKDATIYNNKNGLLSNGIFSVKKIDGKIWVGTYGGGLSIFDGESWKNYNVPDGLADPFMYDVEKMKDGSIWVATWSGANHIVGDIDDPKSWKTYNVKNTNGGLPNDWVYGIEIDNKGIVWFATEGGLARFDGKEWKVWNHENGLGAPYELVKADLPYQDDPTEVSKHHARLMDEQGLTRVNTSYNPNFIVSMVVDSKDRVWLGTWGGGLSVLENGKLRTYTTKDGLAGNHAFTVAEGPDGNIWIGTDGGLSRFDGKTFKNYTTADGLFSNEVFSMAFQDDGSLWVGSFGGASRFMEGLK